MENTNKHNVFSEVSLEKDNRSRIKMPTIHSSVNSFADQFINSNSEQKGKKVQNRVTGQAEFSEPYLQNVKKSRTAEAANTDNHYGGEPVGVYGDVLFENKTKGDNNNRKGSDNLKRNHNDLYTKMHEMGKEPLNKWKFRNLQNRKQTGDMYRKILHFYKKDDFKIFNFAGSRPGEGVSTILANLLDYTKNYAEDKKIIVIDANLQSPDLHKIFNISPRYGLIDIFNNKVNTNEAVVPIGFGIYVLTCGKGADKVSGNLNQENFIKLLNNYRQIYDYIFIDCPPIVSSADALSIAPAADVSFIIIHFYFTSFFIIFFIIFIHPYFSKIFFPIFFLSIYIIVFVQSDFYYMGKNRGFDSDEKVHNMVEMYQCTGNYVIYF